MPDLIKYHYILTLYYAEDYRQVTHAGRVAYEDGMDYADIFEDLRFRCAHADGYGDHRFSEVIFFNLKVL